jgi:hypothetical protein
MAIDDRLDIACVPGTVVHRGATWDVRVFLQERGPLAHEAGGNLAGIAVLPLGTPVSVRLGDGRSSLVVIVGDDNRFVAARAFE